MKKNEKIKKHNFSFKKESPSPTYSLRFVCVLNIGTEYLKFTDVEILGSLGIAQCVLIKTSKSSLFTNVPAYIKTTQFVDICESQIIAVFVLHSYFKNAQLTCTYNLCLYFLQKKKLTQKLLIKMLVILAPGLRDQSVINFTNILPASFLPISFCQKKIRHQLQKQKEKLQKNTFIQKSCP